MPCFPLSSLSRLYTCLGLTTDCGLRLPCSRLWSNLRSGRKSLILDFFEPARECTSPEFQSWRFQRNFRLDAIQGQSFGVLGALGPKSSDPLFLNPHLIIWISLVCIQVPNPKDPCTWLFGGIWALVIVVQVWGKMITIGFLYL